MSGWSFINLHCSWESFLEAVSPYQVSIISPVAVNLLFLNQRKREILFGFLSRKNVPDAKCLRQYLLRLLCLRMEINE